MSPDMLPTTRHIKELIEHSDEHLLSGSERDLKISLIHADNSVEIMLKEYLRYDKEKGWREIENISFHKLLSACSDISLVNSSKSYFLAFHDMRNAVYHMGTLLPTKKDVESALELAKSLFNELHPDTKFEKVRISLPSEESINLVTNTLGSKPYATELSLMKKFTDYLMRQGYLVEFEHLFPINKQQYRADLLAFRGNRAIVCEFKMKPNRNTIGRTMDMLRTFLDQAKEEFPDKKIEGWLIIFKRELSDRTKIAAEKLNIKLIDSKKLKELIGEDFEALD